MGRSPWILLLLLPLLLLGCGDDDDGIVDAGGQDDSYPAADTQDQLVENFEQAWNERKFVEYDRLLHEDFEFRFAVEDVDLSGDPEGVWDRPREAQSTSNLFNGMAGADPITGAEQAPVQKIDLILNPVDIWSDEVPAEWAGTWMREYSVIMQVDYTDGNGAAVQGLQRFYVAPVEIDDGAGGTLTVWQLKFWQDLGKDSAGKRGTADSSWGAVKAQY